MDAIDLYLTRHYQEGQQDSEGHFTVSGARALAKLSSHQLPRNSAWILKMVQAGVVGQAEAMRVRHSARSCAFNYLRAELGSLEDLQAAWSNPTPHITRPQQRLLVGLRSVAFSRRRPVLMCHLCPSKGQRTLLWDGTRLSPIEPACPSLFGASKFKEGEMMFYVSASRLDAHENVGARLATRSSAVEEYKELQDLATCCPIPIKLENLSLNHFGLKDVCQTRQALAFSAEAPKGEASCLPLPPALRETYGLSEKAGLAWTLYESSAPQSSRISWVRDGVVVEEDALPCPASVFHIRLFLSVDDLETDLTELQVRFTETDKFRRVQKAVQSFCQRVEPGGELWNEISRPKARPKSVWAGAACLAIGGALLAPVTGGFSFFAGAGLGYAALRSSSQTFPNEALEEFRRNLLTPYRG